MLGHQSATQTLDRYAALWGDELDAVAERIDAARTAANSRPSRGLTVVALDRRRCERRLTCDDCCFALGPRPSALVGHGENPVGLDCGSGS